MPRRGGTSIGFSYPQEWDSPLLVLRNRLADVRTATARADQFDPQSFSGEARKQRTERDSCKDAAPSA